MSDYKVGFIGGGNMARALVGGLLSSGYRPENLMLAEPNAERRSVLSADLPGVLVSKDNNIVADRADCLVLAVKPQLMRISHPRMHHGRHLFPARTERDDHGTTDPILSTHTWGSIVIFVIVV